MIRLGVLCDTFEIGGQEMGCLQVLRHLDRTRFSPHLYTFRAGALLDEVHALDIPVVVGHDKPGTDRHWTATDDAARKAYRRRLADELRSARIDACLVYAWIDGIPAAQEAGVPAIVERVDGPSLARRIRDKSACQRIICGSQSIRQLILAQRGLIQCEPDRIVVIPTGIDLSRFDPSRYDRARSRAMLDLVPDDFVIGTVGRLSAEKDFGHVLRAMAELIASNPQHRENVRAVMVGPDGGERQALEAEAHSLNVSGRVTFLGPRADVPDLLRAFDVFCMSSRYEGVPHALLEAMAMGLPVVATAVGSIPEVVDGNAYLVQEPDETAAALHELLHNPAQREQLGLRGRARVRDFDLAASIRRYETVIEEALAEARRNR